MHAVIYTIGGRSTEFGTVWMEERIPDEGPRTYAALYDHGPAGYRDNEAPTATPNTVCIATSEDRELVLLAYVAVQRMLEQVEVIQQQPEQVVDYIAKHAFPFDLIPVEDA
jgi:hypothetical protein